MALLLTAYRQGLNPQIRAQMAIYDDNVGLESFMQKAVKISQHLTVLSALHTRSISVLTSCLSSSTWTYASGYWSPLMHWACLTSRHGALPLLRSSGALHSGVPLSSPTPSGEYPLIGACYLYPTTSNGTTTHPTSFHFSTHPRG